MSKNKPNSVFPTIKKLKTWPPGGLFWLLNKPNSFAFSQCCHLLSLLIKMQIRKNMGLTLKMSDSCHMQIWLSLGRTDNSGVIINGKDWSILYIITVD